MHVSEVKINSEDQNRENNLLNLASFECMNIQEGSWRCVSVKDYTSSKHHDCKSSQEVFLQQSQQNTPPQTISHLFGSS